jgi:protein SCO1
MDDLVINGAESVQQFEALVDGLASDPHGCQQLLDLLREDHPIYNSRGANAVVRMRGWVLLSLARGGLPDDALIFLLEELDTGVDPYLVACAARALRSYPTRQAAFAPYLIRAVTHIRYRDDPVSLEAYGEYSIGSTRTTPVRELLKTLTWLGPSSRGVFEEIQSLKNDPGGFSRKFKDDLDQVIAAAQEPRPNDQDDCCALPASVGHIFSRALGLRWSCTPVESTVFEDQNGTSLTFKEFFCGRPSIVVFFYTRCDNPLKCSLTITKLARLQKLLIERGLSEQIQTAAITYDPAFDLPERIQHYGEKRGVKFDQHHRMLRSVEGFDAVRKHFSLGVNFIESLVNRHRIEVHILDERGRVAASFERLHWDEQEVVQLAAGILQETEEATTLSISPHSTEQKDLSAAGRFTSPLFGTLAALGLALFPKCPLCWAGYMSFFGVAGLEGIPYSPWLPPVLAIMIAINLASVWLRARVTGRISGFLLVSAGALMIVLSKATAFDKAAIGGVLLTMAGSFVSTLSTKGKGRSIKTQPASR